MLRPFHNPLILNVFLFLLLLFVAVTAEKQQAIPVESQRVPVGVVSRPIFGTIHGDGYLDFGNVQFDWTPTATATTAAPGNGDINQNKTLKLIAVAMDVSLGATSPQQFQNWQQQTSVNDTSLLHQYLVEEMGIGAFGITDGLYYGCCNSAAVQAGACNDTNKEASIFNQTWMLNFSEWGDGLIMDPSRYFKIHTRHFEVPALQQFGGQLEEKTEGWMEFDMSSGDIALIFANCNDGDQPTDTTAVAPVLIHGGTVLFTSYVSARTLPLYVALTACHFFLATWYRRLMSQNADSRIQVEEWVFYALALAAIAKIFLTAVYTREAMGYAENLSLILAALMASSVSRAVSRCVYLLVALGVGVTMESSLTSRTSGFIGLFLIFYLPPKLLVDWSYVYSDDDDPNGNVLLDQAFNVVIITDIVFLLWIPSAIRETMKILQFRNEPHKLERYQWVWRIYLLAVGLALLQVFILITDINLGIFPDVMAQSEENDVTYLVILTCIAYLWKPNPSQQMYAYEVLGDYGADDALPASMDVELTEDAFMEDDEEEFDGVNKDAPSPVAIQIV